MHNQAIREIVDNKKKITKERLGFLFSSKPRIEKVAIKDAKLRTFIADDINRDELVAHVYDITYGSIKETDNLVIIDDSIVRGTTLQKSILKILDRLNPKKIIVVSSAPQIRYPDCYGIDMARMEDFIAFRAVLELIKENKKDAFNFLNNLKMIDICNNLGDTKSLAIHPATTTHRVLTDEERSNQNIHENLVRLSVGLEDFEDIKNDLDQALTAI